MLLRLLAGKDDPPLGDGVRAEAVLVTPSPSRMGAVSLGEALASTSCRVRPSTVIDLIMTRPISCVLPSASVDGAEPALVARPTRIIASAYAFGTDIGNEQPVSTIASTG